MIKDKQFIIHIGPHKTASTYVQKLFMNNVDALKKLNWSYPEQGLVYYGHHKLAELIEHHKYDLATELLDEIKETPNNIILSSENFDRLDNAGVAFLASHLTEYEVKIIYVYRRYDDKLISSWQESIKHGGVTSWSEFVLEHTLKPFQSKILNDKLILDIFLNNFGRNSLNIIHYDVCIQNDLDIFESFLTILGIESTTLNIVNKSINSSSNYNVIDYLRYLNSIDISFGNEPKHFLRDDFFKYLNSIEGSEVSIAISQCNQKNIEVTFYDNYLSSIFIDNFESDFKDRIQNFDSDFQLCKKTFLLPNSVVLHYENEINKVYKTLKIRQEIK